VEDFLTALGLVFFLEGLPWFMIPGSMRDGMRRMSELPDPLLRQSGLIAMVLGVLVVYLVKG
jgi:hypothetical protein